MSGSYYAFRVRLNAFPKISQIKLVRPQQATNKIPV